MIIQPVIKLGVVGVSRDCFPASLTKKRVAALMAELKKAKVQGVVDCPVTIENEKDALAALDWARKGGKRAFPYFEQEITPVHEATGIEANFDWQDEKPEVKVRATIEGQVGNMFDRTRWIGKFDTIRATGGASRSKGIRDTITNIFGAKVETLDIPDSAALGGALMAARALETI